MERAAVGIRSLEERPNGAGLLAEWFMAEWPEYHRGKTLGDVSSMFRLRDTQRTLIAEIDGEIVGTIAIRNSWSDAPEIQTPWLGGLFVKPAYRRQGIAHELVDAALEAVWAAGHPAVHIALREGVDGYAARGWQVIGTMMTGDEAVTVLRHDRP